MYPEADRHHDRLLTLIYQRQACFMTVLADLLEITGTCIGDLVKEIREILEGHGHPAVAPVGFGTARDLLAFLDQGSDLPDRRWCIGEQSFQLFRNRR